MVDNFPIGLTHLRDSIYWRLLYRDDLDREVSRCSGRSADAEAPIRTPGQMRDIAFIAFLFAFIGLGFRKPFLFVLCFCYIDIVAPQRLSYFLINSIPISLIVFGLAIVGWLAIDDKRDTRWSGRQFLLVALLVYCGITTTQADFPVEAADKWSWVWKALIWAIFLPLTLRTKLRIESLALIMLLSAACRSRSRADQDRGGGGGYGSLQLLLNENYGLYEGSIMSTVGIAIIPLILWYRRHGTIFPPDWRVTTFCFALCFACMLLPIGTQARTGLVCLAVLAVLSLRAVQHRFLYRRGGTARDHSHPFCRKALPSGWKRSRVTSPTSRHRRASRCGRGRGIMPGASVRRRFEAYIQNRLRVETTGSGYDPDNPQNAETVHDEQSRAIIRAISRCWANRAIGPRDVAAAAHHRDRPDGAAEAPLPEDAARRGTMDRTAGDRAPARPYHLYGRVAVRRHRVPAVHLHDAGAGDGSVDLLPPPRAGSGMAPADRTAGAGSGAAFGGWRLNRFTLPFRGGQRDLPACWLSRSGWGHRPCVIPQAPTPTLP